MAIPYILSCVYVCMGRGNSNFTITIYCSSGAELFNRILVLLFKVDFAYHYMTKTQTCAGIVFSKY